MVRPSDGAYVAPVALADGHVFGSRHQRDDHTLSALPTCHFFGQGAKHRVHDIYDIASGA